MTTLDSKRIIRKMKQIDCKIISEAFQLQGWNKTFENFEKYYLEQLKNEREILIAECNGQFAGHITIKWKSNYQCFIDNNIPEIKDLNTLIMFRNRGIATVLMNEAEKIIKEKKYPIVGLGFGLNSDYGTAQKMYIKRGYNLDGNGVMYNGKKVETGEKVIVDDDLNLFMVKAL